MIRKVFNLGVVSPLRRRARWLALGAAGGGLVLAAAVWSVPAWRVTALNLVVRADRRLRPEHVVATQDRVDAFVPRGAVVLAGDSIMAVMPARAIDPLAVNYALGGWQIPWVRARLPRLGSLAHARALVLHVGTNDMAVRSPEEAAREMAALLRELPAHLPVLVCGVPPIEPRQCRDRPREKIDQLNQLLAPIVAARPRSTLLPLRTVLGNAQGTLRADFDRGDGLHLTAAGTQALARAVREHLATLTRNHG
jgi:hypothetical protein